MQFGLTFLASSPSPENRLEMLMLSVVSLTLSVKMNIKTMFQFSMILGQILNESHMLQ